MRYSGPNYAKVFSTDRVSGADLSGLTDALDATDVGELGPLTLPHVQLGMVEAESLTS
jgi:hypothetical protein